MGSSAEADAGRAIVELSRLSCDINDFTTYPELVESVLKKYIHIDWLLMCQVLESGGGATITTGDALPYNWNDLYQEIAPYDRYRDTALQLKPGTALTYRSIEDPSNEMDNYCRAFTKKHTDTVDYMIMPTFKSSNNAILFGFYRTDEKNLFSQEDQQFIETISPILISASNMFMLHRKHDFKRVAFDYFVKSQKGYYAVLDSKLNLVDYPQKTKDLLRSVFKDKRMDRLPEPINKWIKENLTPAPLPITPMPLVFKLYLGEGTLVGYTYPMEGYFFMKLLFQARLFDNEKTLPLTPMETQVLDLLQRGLIVKEIAVRLKISDRGVNFHKYNIVKKTRVSNISEAIGFLADHGVFHPQ